MTNLSELLRDAIPSADIQPIEAALSVGTMPYSVERPELKGPTPDERSPTHSKTGAGRPPSLRKNKRVKLQLDVDADLAVLLKVRAAQEQTSSARIVETALRAYLKL